ncbi:hypothetical protein ACU4GI_32125 [Cupriavidus basilensis]
MTVPDILAPHLTPGGHLLAVPEDAAPILADEMQLRLKRSFALGTGHGLLHLGTAEIGRILPPHGPGGVILPRAMSPPCALRPKAARLWLQRLLPRILMP